MRIKKTFSCFLVFCGVTLAGCSEKLPDQAAEKPLRPVRVLEVSPAIDTLGEEYIAITDAANKADLAFKVAGEIVDFPVQPGNRVNKGQLLARLDDKDFQIQYRDALSSYEKASSDLGRARELLSSNTISKADFDQLNAAFNSAQARLDTAKNNLAYTRLSAPFSGIIAKKYTENFQEVNAKEPVVALHDISRIKLKINIPESTMIRSKKAPPNIVARFDAIEGRTFELKFEEVATQPDEVTKTYEAVASMPAPEEHNILPGMTARVFASKAASMDVSMKIYLPPEVVLKDGSGNYLFTIRDEKDGTATVVKTYVVIGEINPAGIEILSGIGLGDLVLSAGMSKVSDGMKVRYQTGAGA